MKYPILAKSITLLDSATRLPELSASGQMSQTVAAGDGPRGEETIIEVYAHDVAVYREKTDESGTVLKGQFKRIYVIPKSHCRVALVNDDVQPHAVQLAADQAAYEAYIAAHSGPKGEQAQTKVDAEVEAAKPSAKPAESAKKSVVITPKAPKAQE